MSHYRESSTFQICRMWCYTTFRLRQSENEMQDRNCLHSVLNKEAILLTSSFYQVYNTLRRCPMPRNQPYLLFTLRFFTLRAFRVVSIQLYLSLPLFIRSGGIHLSAIVRGVCSPHDHTTGVASSQCSLVLNAQ